MFLVNSRLGLFSAALFSKAPLIPKLRGNFAEFLNKSFLARLWVYYPRPRVSVYGTGSLMINLRNFSWKRGIDRITSSPFSINDVLDLPKTSAFGLKQKSTNLLDLAFSVIPSVTKEVQEYQPVVHRLRFSA